MLPSLQVRQLHVVLIAHRHPLPVRCWESCQSGMAAEMRDGTAESTREAIGYACCVRGNINVEAHLERS